VGFTSDLEERLKLHNCYSKKGWSIRYRPWIVVYTEIYKDKKSAMEREKYLKSGVGRDLIHKEILPSFFH